MAIAIIKLCCITVCFQPLGRFFFSECKQDNNIYRATFVLHSSLVFKLMLLPLHLMFFNIFN
jgi:hypothetical protein